MQNRTPVGSTLSAAVFSLLLSACGGDDNGAVVQPAVSECPASYTVTLLPTSAWFTASDSRAASINNLSQVVGKIGNTAALWSNASSAPRPIFSTFGGFSSSALGINDSAEVVGGAEMSGGNLHAFRYSSDTMSDLGTLGGSSSIASGLNNAGLIVGSSQRTVGDATTHAFLYSAGSMSDLGTLGGAASNATAINTNGQIVGSAQTPASAFHAFLYENGAMRDLGTLGGVESMATAINDAGQVAGSSQTTGSDYHAFLYTAGTMTDISPSTVAMAASMNNRGHIVGKLAAAASPNGWHAFRYCEGKLIDLNTLLSGNSGIELLEASDINNQGEVVGVASSSTSSFSRAFFLRPQ